MHNSNYNTKITVAKDINDIERLFYAEEKDFGRSSYNIKKIGNKLIFDVKAEDATALKIALNTITKILCVWDKTKDLK